MEKVSINLLPTEVSQQQQKQAKFNKIQAISIGVLLVLILVASISVALRIFQSQTIKKLDDQSKALEAKVSNFQKQEENLVVLKNRITAISGLLKGPSIDVVMFNLLSDILPTDVSISTISVDKTGNVVLAITAPNSGALKETLDQLTSDQIFDKIRDVNIESLTGGVDGSYRISLKLFNKG